MSKESIPKAKRSPILLDFDGVAIDDVTPHFEKRFPESGSRVGGAFDEFLYTALRNFRNASAKLIRGRGEELSLDPMATRFMLRHGDEGRRLLLGTANPLHKKEELEEMLKGSGIKDASVYVGTNKEKIELALKLNAILIEDDPWVAGEAARAGVRVILLQKRYNKNPGTVLSALNPRIRMAKSWAELPAILAQMDGRNKDS